VGAAAWNYAIPGRQTFSYRDVVRASAVGNDNAYHEFVMGLLDAGEILIDDIHVIEDPDGAARERLQNSDHMHNHAETTFTNNAHINNGREVEIRFRAKWISGTPLLHTRLFFNRLARTTVLAVPARSGTPGRQNSCFQPNIGPTVTQSFTIPLLSLGPMRP